MIADRSAGSRLDVRMSPQAPRLYLKPGSADLLGVDDLAQYSSRRRPREHGDDVFTEFISPIVFRLAPAVPFVPPSTDPQAWRTRLG